ncbi:MAG: beta-N-acetylhexosaminidase [Prolixibacteraceae bacterium]|nr:beta-N-acetylhexosaminidase [Prolixibacteraceae bacterium]
MSMKKTIVFLSMLAVSLGAFAQGTYPVVPFPNKLVKANGTFEFKAELTIDLPDAFMSELEIIKSIFAEEYNTKVIANSKGRLSVQQNRHLGPEAYTLAVNNDRIEVEASTTTGLFYAVQTIRHLIKLTEGGAYLISACQIADQPMYKWRSFMLDEARYFKGEKIVKELLDQMALLKLNIFHWHLTDDQGWRIEIKKYPLLTEIGSKRDSTQMGIWPGGWESTTFDGVPHQGFYTQQQIKEIIRYAAQRHITIVPEFEIPGHASAAIAAYPWLGSFNQQIKVPGTFGVHYQVFNIIDPKVESFLKDVLDEIIALFPSPVIHIGGDEVKYDQWKNSPDVNAFMTANNIASYADLQVWFTNKISIYIGQKGRRMMGWNEIMGTPLHEYSETGHVATEKLAQNSIVHFWKGDLKLIDDAVTKGYDIVNSFHEFTYLDYNFNKIPLEKSYNFNPTPENLSPMYKKQILGFGCQMWSEWIPSVQSMQLQIFPRLAAYAEVGWTEVPNKDFDRFKQSLTILEQYWNRKGISYYDKQ